jgi:hypothetical protein
MLLLVLALLTFCGLVANDRPQPTAAEIMHRVAENQDREQKARDQFIYEQKTHRTTRGKDGKLLREEYWTFAVIPGVTRSEKKLLSVKGHYWKDGKYLPNLDDDNDSSSRDGIDKDLFPLTSDEQKKYTFERTGERVVNGRAAYQVQFRPINRNEYGWKGEAFIDEEEFQPVSVYTKLSRKLPFAVRTMLGSDVHGLGFSVQYRRVDKDLWFPSSYGTEFSVHALFLLNRTITESMENLNFRRATVESRIGFVDNPAK